MNFLLWLFWIVAVVAVILVIVLFAKSKKKGKQVMAQQPGSTEESAPSDEEVPPSIGGEGSEM